MIYGRLWSVWPAQEKSLFPKTQMKLLQLFRSRYSNTCCIFKVEPPVKAPDRRSHQCCFSQSSISSRPWANAAARFSEAAFKLPPLRISHRPRVHNNELRLATWFSDEGSGLLIDDWTRCGKKSGKVRAGRCVHGKEGMRRKKWSEWLLRRQRPCCPGPDSTLYIRCPPPSLPSELLIQFHPHEGISSTAPSLIYPSIHLSLPQQMGKITRNNATTNSPPSLLLAILHSNLTSSEVGPSGGKRYVWITQRMRAVGFWCQRIGHSADVGFGVGWFCITID